MGYSKYMKTTIICGMLGAGKTTFIRQFITGITGRAVVLVNDFGKAGIDGEIFEAGGIESIELPSGCVCCTLKFDLITTIQKIIETHAPEHLLIEPSGVAAPSGVLEALDVLKIGMVTVIGIVDATEFLELYEAEMFGRFFEDQIANSDVILVNKADLIEREIVERTVRTVEQMNPNAIVYQTVNCSTSGPIPEMTTGERSAGRHAHHFHFETVSLKLGDDLDLESISSFFHEMTTGRYGDIVRAKALVNTVQGPFKFDLSFANVQSVPFEKAVSESRIVIIGKGLSKEALSSVI
jgi:G3E family GTPase